MQAAATVNRLDLRLALQTINRLNPACEVKGRALDEAVKRIAAQLLEDAPEVTIHRPTDGIRVATLHKEHQFQVFLGRGASKIVQTALTWHPDGKVEAVALSSIHATSEEVRDDAEQEIKISKVIQKRCDPDLQHLFVTHVFNWEVGDRHYIVSPLQTEGTLKDWCRGDHSLRTRLEYALGFTKTVQAFKEMKLFHSDLRTANMMMPNRLIDWGCVVDIADPKSHFRGSHQEAMSPEIRRRASGNISRAASTELKTSPSIDGLKELERLESTDKLAWLKFQAKFRRFPVLVDQPTMYFAADMYALGKVFSEIFPAPSAAVQRLMRNMRNKDWNLRPKTEDVIRALEDILAELAHPSCSPSGSSEEDESHSSHSADDAFAVDEAPVPEAPVDFECTDKLGYVAVTGERSDD